MFFNLEKSTAALNWALAGFLGAWTAIMVGTGLYKGAKTIQYELEVKKAKKALAAKQK